MVFIGWERTDAPVTRQRFVLWLYLEVRVSRRLFPRSHRTLASRLGRPVSSSSQVFPERELGNPPALGVRRAIPRAAREVIVANDAGGSTREIEELLGMLPGKHRYLSRRRPAQHYGNPAKARNQAYRHARGDILICQSDDVVHAAPDTIERLVSEMQPGRFVIATVTNTDWDLKPTPCLHPDNPNLTLFTGPANRRPLFFLGAVYREDVYAIGGNDERFTTPGYEDNFFADCLMKGRGLVPHYSTVQGYHLHHDRPTVDAFEPSRKLYQQLMAEERWIAQGGPWPMERNA